jgi:hypothetical protein
MTRSDLVPCALVLPAALCAVLLVAVAAFGPDPAPSATTNMQNTLAGHRAWVVGLAMLTLAATLAAGAVAAVRAARGRQALEAALNRAAGLLDGPAGPAPVVDNSVSSHHGVYAIFVRFHQALPARAALEARVRTPWRRPWPPGKPCAGDMARRARGLALPEPAQRRSHPGCGHRRQPQKAPPNWKAPRKEPPRRRGATPPGRRGRHGHGAE